MRSRMFKLMLALMVAVMLVPVISAQAATNLTANNITNSSVTLNWTLQSGETTVQINKNGVYQATIAGSTYVATGLSTCTSYTFDVIGSGTFGSLSKTVTTAGCPTAPVITYSATWSQINLSWTASNAVSYEILRNDNHVNTVTGTSTTITTNPSLAEKITIIAKNSTGQTASSTVWVSTPQYTGSVSGTAYGQVKLNAFLRNSDSLYSQSIYIELYRNGTWVSETIVTLNAGQSLTGTYTLATGQPYDNYTAQIHSPKVAAYSLSLTGQY
ncbi:hypothetical protein [Cohnella yongneupensis]|uniref:Fibronectin type-III domain-containing protein n=1 Tax=Cohnella yongneupensis TaxID=425006 RepID=A0ABW0QWF7_9BACL